MKTMKTRSLGWIAALATSLLAQAAIAGPGYSLLGIVASPANAPKIAAAYAKLNDAPIMKEAKSRRMLLQNLADGANPATHSFVVVFPSLAHAESFQAKLAADPAWTEFLETVSPLATGADSVRVQTLRSWGDIADSDVLWQNFAFRVTNPSAFIAANERFLASRAGKTFPGQSHLVSVTAGGLSPATHALVVGYASDAESEAWNDKMASDPDWILYLRELEDSADFLGATVSRTLAAYGPSLASTLGR